MTTLSHLSLLLSLPLLLAAVAAAPPPPSATADAAQTLNLHGGYSLSAALLAKWNGSGTFLAPPDYAFPVLRRRSLPLLLSHTLKPRLTGHDLAARATQELPTWLPHRCLVLSISAVRILHPDIYADDHLTVHGINTALEPTSCYNPTAGIKSQPNRATFLDRAARVLRRKGFGVVAAALAIKKPHLLRLPAVTVFATSDVNLFSGLNGFRYDFLRHVAPKRYCLEDVSKLTAIQTLSPEKTIAVGSVMGFSEIYHNSWIVVIAIPKSFDYAGEVCGGRPEKDLAGGLPPMPVARVGAYGEVDTAEESHLATEEKLCSPADYLFCPVRERGLGSGDTRNDLVGESEPSVSKKVVQSAPSHQMNNAGEKVVKLEPGVMRQLKEGSVVDIARRRKLGVSGVGRNTEADHVVELADDLFYYA